MALIFYKPIYVTFFVQKYKDFSTKFLIILNLHKTFHWFYGFRTHWLRILWFPISILHDKNRFFKNCSIVDTIGTWSSVISVILIDLLRTKYWYGYHFDQEKILNNPSSFTVKWSASKWCQKYPIIFNLITVYEPKHGQVEPNKTLICNKTAYQVKYSLFQYSLSVDLKSQW